MSDDLLMYYERELAFFRQISAEFAGKYPKIASRLALEADRCEDPHVERLIQAFAFLTARVHHKIDDEFPEITESLLNVLYPHYLQPVPSMSIVQFVLDPERGNLTGGYRIDKHTLLYAAQPVHDTHCRFQTCYPVTLWPIEVVAARLEEPDSLRPSNAAVAVLRLQLRAQGGTTWAQLAPERLRFFLNGEPQLVYGLYELLCNNACHVQLREPGESGRQPLLLSSSSLQTVGFGPEEGMLPYESRSFLGYRLLLEYFTCPEKFLFFDLSELERAGRAGFGDRLDVLIFFDRIPRFEQAINAGTFRLGCTPIINLFHQLAEPIRVTSRPDGVPGDCRCAPPGRPEVYAIQDVRCAAPHLPEPMTLQPFYSLRHAAASDGQPQAFWYATRRPSQKQGDTGTEVYLALVDSQLPTHAARR